MKSHERQVGESKVLFLSTVRGLLSEAAEVRARAHAFQPDCIVLPIGGREHAEIETTLKERGQLPGREGNQPSGAARRHGPTGLMADKIARDPQDDDSDYDDFGLFMSTSDMVFMKHLSKWGAVEAPAPSYQEAVRLGNERGIPVEPVDFDDDAYTDVFLQNVSAFTLVRQGRVLRKLARRRFKEESPEAFALQWDARVNKLRGYRAVEVAREGKVAQGVRRAAQTHRRVLAVVELERTAGILAQFDRGAQGPAPDPSPPRYP